MEKINVEFAIEQKSGNSVLCVKVLDKQWSSFKGISLFGEIAESLISCSYNTVCIDFSDMAVVTSSVFGVCMNIGNLAKEQNKKLYFILNKDAAETARLAALDKLATIEET